MIQKEKPPGRCDREQCPWKHAQKDKLGHQDLPGVQGTDPFWEGMDPWERALRLEEREPRAARFRDGDGWTEKQSVRPCVPTSGAHRRRATKCEARAR